MNVRAGIGWSRSGESFDGGVAAARAALDQLEGVEPALVLVHASVAHDLGALLEGIRSVTGETPLAGCTTSGQFCDGELIEPGSGVSVLALSSGGYRFGVASVRDLAADAESAGRELARAARDAAGPVRAEYSALLLWSDGLFGNQQHLLNGIHRVAGATVPVAGGAAGDDRRLERCFVLHDGEAFDDAAVGVWIDSDRPLVPITRHGWHPIGAPVLVTRADGMVIQELGHRPAADLFQENFGPEPGDTIGTRPRQGYRSTHAFGLIEPDGSMLIRGAYLVGDDAVRTFTPIPQYSAVQVVTCGDDDLLRVTEEVAEEAVASGGSVLLAFSCVARLDILGSRAPEEPKRLQAVAGAMRTFGFHTYGEFARTTGVAGVHNASLVGITL